MLDGLKILEFSHIIQIFFIKIKPFFYFIKKFFLLKYIWISTRVSHLRMINTRKFFIIKNDVHRGIEAEQTLTPLLPHWSIVYTRIRLRRFTNGNSNDGIENVQSDRTAPVAFDCGRIRLHAHVRTFDVSCCSHSDIGVSRGCVGGERIGIT